MSNEEKVQCAVKGKIKCVFQSVVVASASSKRKGQNYKVTASNKLNNEFMRHVKQGI